MRDWSRAGVSIIVSTKRPHHFNNILKNYSRQRYRLKELIIILHKNNINLEHYRKKAQRYHQVSVYQMSEKYRLGRCLNYGISKSRYPVIAKFDDDDYYSPYYLSEQVKALYRKKTDVVGKRAYYVYLKPTKKLIIRFPKQRKQFVKFVTGGTLLFKKKLKVRFSPQASLGEDINFLEKCRKRGYKIYSTTPYNYVYLRRNNRSHSWKTSMKYLMKGSKFIKKTAHYRKMTTRKV
ncbi:glycosyl transferase family 2 [Paenibacillus rigui]|uniref:Glycosyl transferase family 2 n=1 Tax=Paenibacillus rigui TaxID=554312 RepID=A0A229UM05_9BACL|nr:glycosyl transferase family 2 [Paenibacillus rigui]